jgi:hypothetical protein
MSDPEKLRIEVVDVLGQSRAEWHLLGLAFRCAMARLARELRSPHHLLQPLRSVAARWSRETNMRNPHVTDVTSASGLPEERKPETVLVLDTHQGDTNEDYDYRAGDSVCPD